MFALFANFVTEDRFLRIAVLIQNLIRGRAAVMTEIDRHKNTRITGDVTRKREVNVFISC